MDELTPLGYTEDDIIESLFILEFASLHSTAMVCTLNRADVFRCLIRVPLQSLTHGLFVLAADPDYASLLRKEVDATYKEAGGTWSKESVSKLRRVDSFLKEAQRVYGVNASKSVGITLHSYLSGCFYSFTRPKSNVRRHLL